MTGTCHAEVLSIAWLRNHIGKVKSHTRIELIIFRKRKDGSFGMAKPCAHCVKMLKKAVNVYGFNIRRVSYTIDDGSFESCTVDELNNDFLTSGTRTLALKEKIKKKTKKTGKRR